MKFTRFIINGLSLNTKLSISDFESIIASKRIVEIDCFGDKKRIRTDKIAIWYEKEIEDGLAPASSL